MKEILQNAGKTAGNCKDLIRTVVRQEEEEGEHDAYI
jgi:hypothetical protein